MLVLTEKEAAGCAVDFEIPPAPNTAADGEAIGEEMGSKCPPRRSAESRERRGELVLR